MHTKPPVEAVTFDLWNTLLVHDVEYDSGIRMIRTEGILEALGQYGVGAADVERAYELSDKLLLERWSCHLDMDLGEQLSLFLECMGLEPTGELVRAIDGPYGDAVLKMKPTVVEGALEAVVAIKDRGYRVGLISNTGRTPGRAMRKVLDQYGFSGLFEVESFSNEIGYQKPHPEIFHRTLLKLMTGPENAIHVGDHGLLDVLGAREAGMRSVQVTRHRNTDFRQYRPDASIGSISDLPKAIDDLKRE
jgi:FMN phosphatase YigB (HAD superfamily)